MEHGSQILLHMEHLNFTQNGYVYWESSGEGALVHFVALRFSWRNGGGGRGGWSQNNGYLHATARVEKWCQLRHDM